MERDPNHDRRGALRLIGGAGLATVTAACGSSAQKLAASTTTTSTTSTTARLPSSAPAAAPVTAIPDETAGPYPGDGSNGPDVLTENGVVRSDMRTSFGSRSGTAQGVPITIKLKVVDVRAGGTPLAGAGLYLWHADRDGNYSLYTASSQNYLRGVQAADGDGVVTFRSIFPGCYAGRWPHMHFEIYESVKAALSGGTKLKTSQLALPEDVCKAVYGSADGYAQSVTNLSRVSLQTDMVFRDGWTSELATATGSVKDGYTVALTIGV